MDAVTSLNKVCQEVGVCEPPKIVRAAELYKDGISKVIRTCCWSDGRVTSCVVEKDTDGKTKEEACCYTAESGGEKLYYSWQALLTSPEVGYKIKTVEVE